MRTSRLTVLVTAVAALAVTACGGPAAEPAAGDDRTAEVVAVDDGLTYLVTGDAAVRIQQPRAAELVELTAEGVTVGDEVARFTVGDGPTGSAFVVVPPDGPDARLHLLVDGVLHPVVTRSGELADLADAAEAPVAFLAQLEVGP